MPSVATIPDSDAPNWIIVPATRCIQVAADGAKLSGLLQRAVMALAQQEALLLRVEAIAISMGASKRLNEPQPALDTTLIGWANELLEDDLHAIHVPGIIALWASLEVAVEDTATLILVNDPKAVDDVVKAGSSVPSSWPLPLDEGNARRLFSRFEQASRKTRSIAEAYCHILETLGVSASVEPAVLETLMELNYVRNCVLHRGGVVDARVAAEAPNSGLVVGDVIRIVQEDYLRYFHAVGSFAQELLKGAIASRHARWKP